MGLKISDYESIGMQAGDVARDKIDELLTPVTKTYVKATEDGDATGKIVCAGNVVDVLGIPGMLGELTPSSTVRYTTGPNYYLTDNGYYAFLTIVAGDGRKVANGFSVTGAEKYITPDAGTREVKIAVKFDACAASQDVTVCWDGYHTDAFTVRALDLLAATLSAHIG